MSEFEERREADLLIEVGHPSRPDREELMRSHIARIKARAKAEALREAAVDVLDMGDVWGGSERWLTTGDKVAQLVADLLRALAADREATA